MDASLLTAAVVSATVSALPAFVLFSSLIHMLGNRANAGSTGWLVLAAVLSLPLFILTAGLPVTGQLFALDGFGWILFALIALPFAAGFLFLGRGPRKFGRKDGLALTASVISAVIFCGFIFTR